MQFTPYLEFCIQVFELLTALLATWYWKKYKDSTERNFIYFFWVLFIIDLTGVILNKKTDLDTYFIYNSFNIFHFAFLLRWYTKILVNKSIVFLNIGYVLFLIFVIIQYNIFESFIKIHYVVGVIIILICTFLYSTQVLNSNKIFNLKYSLSFWITIGHIILFVGMIPLVLLLEYMKINALSFKIVLILLNFIAYTCYSLGFIWTKKQ